MQQTDTIPAAASWPGARRKEERDQVSEQATFPTGSASRGPRPGNGVQALLLSCPPHGGPAHSVPKPGLNPLRPADGVCRPVLGRCRVRSRFDKGHVRWGQSTDREGTNYQPLDQCFLWRLGTSFPAHHWGCSHHVVQGGRWEPNPGGGRRWGPGRAAGARGLLTFQILVSLPYTTAMLLALPPLMSCFSASLSSSDTKPMKELSGVCAAARPQARGVSGHQGSQARCPGTGPLGGSPLAGMGRGLGGERCRGERGGLSVHALALGVSLSQRRSQGLGDRGSLSRLLVFRRGTEVRPRAGAAQPGPCAQQSRPSLVCCSRKLRLLLFSRSAHPPSTSLMSPWPASVAAAPHFWGAPGVIFLQGEPFTWTCDQVGSPHKAVQQPPCEPSPHSRPSICPHPCPLPPRQLQPTPTQAPPRAPPHPGLCSHSPAEGSLLAPSLCPLTLSCHGAPDVTLHADVLTVFARLRAPRAPRSSVLLASVSRAPGRTEPAGS